MTLSTVAGGQAFNCPQLAIEPSTTYSFLPLFIQPSYAEVESGDSIEIEITPDSRPTKLLATIFTQPGEVMVSDLLHLSPAERELVVDMPPGRYNVRLHAQWFEGGSEVQHKVNYVFGLRVPGEPELKRQ